MCTLCEAVAGRSVDRIVHQERGGCVLLSSDLAVRGHLVVVSPAHVENLSELAPDAAGAFLDLLRRAEEAVLRATGAERAILMKLGLAVPHLHVHIYPFSRSATRAEVFAAIDMKTRDELGEEELDALIRSIQRELTAGNG
jgi:diadenosine tetraphosphate (Ap4A) HIT family hydrolase